MSEISQATRARFMQLQIHSLIGVWIGYAAYYLVRSNFNLATPYLAKELSLTKTEIGLLMGCMMVTYGLSKGFMSMLSDKANPKYFMSLGLAICILINVLMSFSTNFTLFIGLVVLLGLFQGMGVGPSIVTVGYWFPRSRRGRASTIWNMSHNFGGGVVGPIVGAAVGYLGVEHWRLGVFGVPAILAAICVIFVLYFVRKRPVEEGLPTVEEMFNEEAAGQKTAKLVDKKPENMNAFQVFFNYVFKNPNSWYLVLIDIFVYMVRFGMISWIPIYLLNVKGFSKGEMGVAYMFFELAAIPSTLIAGYLVDKYFKGRIMILPIICLTVIFACLVGYMESNNILLVTIFASIVGCLVYIPQSMIPVQAMEVIPTFALGSAVGLRGLCSYLFGAMGGTALFGFVADHWGWTSAFYTLMVAVVLCMASCYLSHLGIQKVYKKAMEQEAQ